MAENKKCYNCKYSGKQFKIAGKTHLYCEHPKYPEEDKDSGKISPYDTLMEFWNTCEDHELKQLNNIEDKTGCNYLTK